MTISSTVRIAGPYIGSGAATVFPFAFKVFAAAEMQVAKLNTTSNVETILTLTTDYTVQLNGDQNGTPGGTITLPAVLASGFNLTITSDIANLQPTDLTNQGGFYPEVITDALDRATIQIQQLDQNSRAIKIPLSDGVLDMTTPVVAERASKYLAFDAAGLPVVSAGTGSDSALRTDLAVASAVSAGSRLSGFRQTGTGATARTVDAKLKDTVSVKDFGAVGDGVTNDTAAIDLAIASGADNIYFPMGTYMTTGNHTVTTQKLYGSNRLSSIIKKISGTNTIIKLLNTSTMSGQISDLTLDGSSLAGHGLFVGSAVNASSYQGLSENLIIKNIGTTPSTVNISAITLATNGQVTTSTAHGLAIGDVVTIKGIQGVDCNVATSINKITNAGTGGTPGTYTGVQLTYVSGETATTYPIATIVVSAGGIVSSVTITTAPTGYMERNYSVLTCNLALIGNVSAFEVEVIPYGSVSRSLLNATIQVKAVGSPTTFTTIYNTTGFSAYVSGGTVEKASYGICVAENTPTYSTENKVFRNIQLSNNYGHIYMQNNSYCIFSNIDMYGNHTGGYGIYIGYAVLTPVFENVYMESGIATSTGYSNRHITLRNFDVLITNARTWTKPWLYSEGFNSTTYLGGENAGLVVDGLRFRRDKTGQALVPIILTNSYQCTINRVNIIESANTNWGIIRDCGCRELRVQDLTCESTNAWDLFYSQSSGGFTQRIDGVTYTQGVSGSITLSGTNPPGTQTSLTSVKNCTGNISIRRNDGIRAYWFENITGNLDLTNASNIGCFVYNIVGTITDPGTTNAAKAVTLGLNTSSYSLVINPFYVYADNATAIAAGRGVGEVYRTATGVLMTRF